MSNNLEPRFDLTRSQYDRSVVTALALHSFTPGVDSEKVLTRQVPAFPIVTYHWDVYWYIFLLSSAECFTMDLVFRPHSDEVEVGRN